ncbi:MAG: hypothetical protein K6E30_08140 [Lachnospiraceae bacterium]|nr:hypothetical protein [Lachnospiraceae bacterium]
MEKITDGFKTLLLAAVGAAALTADKSQEILKELVSRGELTVEQGKALNQELKHKFSEAGKEKEKEDTAVADFLKGLSPEELEALKQKIRETVSKDGDE